MFNNTFGNRQFGFSQTNRLPTFGTGSPTFGTGNSHQSISDVYHVNYNNSRMNQLDDRFLNNLEQSQADMRMILRQMSDINRHIADTILTMRARETQRIEHMYTYNVNMERQRQTQQSRFSRTQNTLNRFGVPTQTIRRSPVNNTTARSNNDILFDSRIDASNGLIYTTYTSTIPLTQTNEAVQFVQRGGQNIDTQMRNINRNITDIITTFLEPIPVVPTRDQINAATRRMRFRDLADDVRENNPRCPIDISEFSDDDIILRIQQCGHVFRRENLLNWFRRMPTCPVCRGDIRGNVENQLQHEFDELLRDDEEQEPEEEQEQEQETEQETDGEEEGYDA